MARLNKTCLACRTKYSYCPSCSRIDALKPSWASEFCSATCKDLWFTATRFNMNILTKAEAKSIILELDLKPIDQYAECVQRDFKNIMAEEKKPKRNRRIEIKPIDEVIDVEHEMIESVFEENQLIIKVDAEIKEIAEDKVTVEIAPRKKVKEESREVVITENE